jgi:hypothetical protein
MSESVSSSSTAQKIETKKKKKEFPSSEAPKKMNVV